MPNPPRDGFGASHGSKLFGLLVCIAPPASCDLVSISVPVLDHYNKSLKCDFPELKMAPSGRLYAKAVFTGYKRGQRNQHENTALLQVEGCAQKEDARWYIGKRCAFVYKAKNKTPVPGSDVKSQMRVIWGKVNTRQGPGLKLQFQSRAHI